MRDFNWEQTLWAVVKNDGSFAGVPCTGYDEACDLAAQHEGAKVFQLCPEFDFDDEPDNIDDDCGFDPYEGCFTFDC